MDYSPQPTNRIILDVAMDHILSVPYSVSLRWVFYRLLQDGYYSTKEDYNSWKSLASTARKRFYHSWKPDTLKDETRSVVIRNGGYADEASVRESYFQDLIENNPVYIDHFNAQQESILICFEARAMTDQFRHYTGRVDLVPFGGDPSIPLKWDVAKKIEAMYDLYFKPVRVLYFGDYDKKGLLIADSAMKDVRKWCGIDFELTKCGLTLSQAIEHNVPENPDKPGEYQWEALPDEAAREIITEAIDSYIDGHIQWNTHNLETELTAEFKEDLENLSRGKTW